MSQRPRVNHEKIVATKFNQMTRTVQNKHAKSDLNPRLNMAIQIFVELYSEI